MANPTPEAYDKLRAQITVLDIWDLTDEQIVTQLNLKNQPHPTPAPQVPRKLLKAEAVALLSDESRIKLVNYVNLAMVFESFDVQDHTSCIQWAQVLASVGIITPAEAGAVIGYVSTQINDPAHPAYLSWSHLNLGRDVDTDDIADARKDAPPSLEWITGGEV